MTAAVGIRGIEGDAVVRDWRDADLVMFLDLDGDGVPDAVRTRTTTHTSDHGARMVETVEAVDDDGNVRLLSLVERFEQGQRTAVA